MESKKVRKGGREGGRGYRGVVLLRVRRERTALLYKGG